MTASARASPEWPSPSWPGTPSTSAISGSRRARTGAPASQRAEEDGFVEAIDVRDGQAVRPGDVVPRLANPALAARLARQSGHVAALDVAPPTSSRRIDR